MIKLKRLHLKKRNFVKSLYVRKSKVYKIVFYLFDLVTSINFYAIDSMLDFMDESVNFNSPQSNIF